MLTIKVSEEEMAAYGVTDKPSLFVALQRLATAEAEKAEAAKETQKMTAELEALTKRVETLEALVMQDEDSQAQLHTDLIAEAVAESTKACTGLLAKIGAQALPPSQPVTDDSPAANQIADDDWEGQWKSNASIRNEFRTQSLYEAFKKAEKGGQVRILKAVK
jgi:hypothetical protein